MRMQPAFLALFLLSSIISLSYLSSLANAKDLEAEAKQIVNLMKKELSFPHLDIGSYKGIDYAFKVQLIDKSQVEYKIYKILPKELDFVLDYNEKIFSDSIVISANFKITRFDGEISDLTKIKVSDFSNDPKLTEIQKCSFIFGYDSISNSLWLLTNPSYRSENIVIYAKNSSGEYFFKKWEKPLQKSISVAIQENIKYKNITYSQWLNFGNEEKYKILSDWYYTNLKSTVSQTYSNTAVKKEIIDKLSTCTDQIVHKEVSKIKNITPNEAMEIVENLMKQGFSEEKAIKITMDSIAESRRQSENKSIESAIIFCNKFIIN